MFRLLNLLLTLFAVASAFTTNPFGLLSRTTLTSRSMFSADDTGSSSSTSSSSDTTLTPPVAPPLQSVDEPLVEKVEQEQVYKSVVKNMNTGEVQEVKWVDPAMEANTQPWMMSWWAYLLFGFPFVLLLDDAFHFLPKDGLFAFLQNV